MKKIILITTCLMTLVLLSRAQEKYFSDIVIKQHDVKYGNGYTTIPFNYWRHDTCLYSKQMCLYNSSTAASVKINTKADKVVYEFLRGNNSGYQSENPYDTFKYFFVPQNINASMLIRSLLIKETYMRKDTFKLSVVDTLVFDNYSLIGKVFGKSKEDVHRKNLKIYVLKSVDNFGSVMFHYWVEKIGVIKLTDEKCWRYSFEMKDDRTKPIKKMFAELTKVIKENYKDPYWLSQPCNVE